MYYYKVRTHTENKKKMKKKILAFVLIIVVFALALSGCSFIKLNADRQSSRVIRTVTKDNVSLNITYTELKDYTNSLLYGSFYSYVSQGYMSVSDVVDYALAAKTQSKALTITAMEYLKTLNRQNLVGDAMYNELVNKYGSDNINKQVLSALTIAEYYDAIASVNESLDSLVENYKEEYYNNQRKDTVYSADLQDVKEIKIVQGVEDEYYVGSVGPKTEDIKIEVSYTEESKKEAITLPITSSMISKAFSSSSAAEDSEFIVKLDVEVMKDGKYTANVVTATKTYNVVEAPTTRENEEDEKVALEEIRYKSASEIAYWAETNGVDYGYEIPAIVDLDAQKTSSDAATAYAWTEVEKYLKDAGRTMDYYYASAIESEVISAYKAEINKLSEEEFSAQLDTEVAKKITELQNDSIKNYKDKTVAAQKTAFISAIEDTLDSLYYVPEIGQVKGYFYVSHLLIKDSSIGDEFTEQGSDDQLIADNIGTMTVDEINTRFDVSYECDGWEYNEEGAYVHNESKCSDKETQDKSQCKSIAYLAKDVKATTVLDNLAKELNGETDGAKRVAIFNNYVEKYGQDPGILSKTNGYLITPDVDDMSWVDGFESLGILLGASANYQNVGTYKVDKDAAVASFKSLYGLDDAKANELYEKYNKNVNVYTADDGSALYYTIANTVSSGGYAGIHVMMVTFFPFSADWTADSVINIDGDKLSDSVRESTLDTKLDDDYTAKTDWLSDYETDDNGYTITLGKKYTEKGFSVKDHKKIGDYISDIVESIG